MLIRGSQIQPCGRHLLIAYHMAASWHLAVGADGHSNTLPSREGWSSGPEGLVISLAKWYSLPMAEVGGTRKAAEPEVIIARF